MDTWAVDPPQRKGTDGERGVARVLTGYGYDLQRGGPLSFGEVPDLVDLPGAHIEVKRAEQLRPYDWTALYRGLL